MEKKSKPYTKKEQEDILDVIRVNKLCFINEIPLYFGYSLQQFYLKCQPETEFHNEVVAMLTNNKIMAKAKLRRNWEKDDASPMLQLALYRVLGSDKEREKLSTYIRAKEPKKDEKTNEPIQITIINSDENKHTNPNMDDKAGDIKDDIGGEEKK